MPVTEGEWWFGAGFVAVDGGEALAGPIEQCAFTVRRRELPYEIRPLRGWPRWRHVVEVRGAAGAVPAVQVRARADLPPLRPDDGHEVARFPTPGPAGDVLRGEFTARPTERLRTLHLRLALDLRPRLDPRPSTGYEVPALLGGRGDRPAPLPGGLRGTGCSSRARRSSARTGSSRRRRPPALPQAPRTRLHHYPEPGRRDHRVERLGVEQTASGCWSGSCATAAASSAA